MFNRPRIREDRGAGSDDGTLLTKQRNRSWTEIGAQRWWFGVRLTTANYCEAVLALGNAWKARLATPRSVSLLLAVRCGALRCGLGLTGAEVAVNTFLISSQKVTRRNVPPTGRLEDETVHLPTRLFQGGS